MILIMSLSMRIRVHNKMYSTIQMKYFLERIQPEPT